MSDKKIKTAILISGRGSNMEALIKASLDKNFPAHIALVGSNKADAAGLVFAQKNGIETFILNHKEFASREAFDAQLNETLTQKNIQLVCLAGFMRILTPMFCERWENRLINIHPSLLPAYKGLDTHQRAIADGQTRHGCTVHFVTPGMDEGPIIAQSELDILAQDTPETLAKRVLTLEHMLYPQALKTIASKMLSHS